MKLVIPKPIQMPWKLKPLNSADTKVETLSDGRLKIWIRHEVLKGVTPEMLVWWFQNINGTIEVEGKTYPRYRVWHFRDHLEHRYVRKCADGTVGPGTIMHITEIFDQNPNYLIDNDTIIEKLDESGLAHCPMILGVKVARMDYSFKAVPGGTLYENSLIAGLAGPMSFLNRLLIPRLFPEAKSTAWLTHNVEEVGSFEHFLPRLYAEQNPEPKVRFIGRKK